MGQHTKRLEQVAVVHPNAAGLDIGAREIWACVPPDREGESVRSFATFTPDLYQLADWLAECGVDTVAMESTGVYWIPVFEILEARGLKVCLVNARHIKNVPGRKSDYQDCQWIQKLHALGLLNGSFRPDGEMCRLRTYLRHRAQLIQHRAPHILHMQKAMQQMNLQLHHVLTDITGATGLRILRAIIAGERDALKLAQWRDAHCKASEATIVKALTGDWKEEQLFVLKQSLELYDFYTAQVAACDAQLQQQFSAMKPRWDTLVEPSAALSAKRRTSSKNQPTFDVRAEMIRLTGIDLGAIKGLSDSSIQTILSEIGTDMTKWPTEKHFVSWLGLAPHNDISGGKVLRSRTLPTHNRAGQAFRQAATAVAHSPSVFGAYYRRKRAQGGPRFAQVATAHKMARTVYFLLKYHVPYIEIGAEVYEQKQREREVTSLRKKAAKLGFTLATLQPAQIDRDLTA
jgi:transposase